MLPHIGSDTHLTLSAKKCSERSWRPRSIWDRNYGLPLVDQTNVGYKLIEISLLVSAGMLVVSFLCRKTALCGGLVRANKVHKGALCARQNPPGEGSRHLIFTL
jgi:hypothetical protein